MLPLHGFNPQTSLGLTPQQTAKFTGNPMSLMEANPLVRDAFTMAQNPFYGGGMAQAPGVMGGFGSGFNPISQSSPMMSPVGGLQGILGSGGMAQAGGNGNVAGILSKAFLSKFQQPVATWNQSGYAPDPAQQAAAAARKAARPMDTRVPRLGGPFNRGY